MPWEKNIDGRFVPQPAPAAPGASLGSGAVRAGPPPASQLARELHKRHKREGADIRKALRLARAARRAARGVAAPVVHACPTSTPRPREGGARMGAASGRHGNAERDDGSGSDGDGGGGGEPPPPRLHAPFSRGVR